MESKNRNILIDGNNLLHRAYYVFVTLPEKQGRPAYTSKSGYGTGLIYGALSMLSDWIDEISNPTKLILFLDGVPAKRLSVYPDYKKKDGGRNKMCGESVPLKLSDGYYAKNDLDILYHILKLVGVDIYKGDNEEADDLVASFISQHKDDVNIIISSDRDFYQLLSAKTVIYRPGIQGNRFFDMEKATEDMQKVAGVQMDPTKIRMLKSLVGDSSDNIVGVPRLRKKAVAALCDHPNIESLYASGFPGFSDAEKEKVIANKERVVLNYKLVGLDSNIELSQYKQTLPVDFTMVKQILSEDLSINGVDTNCFKMLSQNNIHYQPMIPDYLQGISL
jgi:5'-3' exonuclease